MGIATYSCHGQTDRSCFVMVQGKLLRKEVTEVGGWGRMEMRDPDNFFEKSFSICPVLQNSVLSLVALMNNSAKRGVLSE